MVESLIQFQRDRTGLKKWRLRDLVARHGQVSDRPTTRSSGLVYEEVSTQRCSEVQQHTGESTKFWSAYGSPGVSLTRMFVMAIYHEVDVSLLDPSAGEGIYSMFWDFSIHLHNFVWFQRKQFYHFVKQIIIIWPELARHCRDWQQKLLRSFWKRLWHYKLRIRLDGCMFMQPCNINATREVQ